MKERPKTGPRYNCYRCQYGCNTFTVDVDKGITPFIIKCKSVSKPGRLLNPILTGEDGECIGIAKSCFYPKAALPDFATVTHEWYRPLNTEGLTEEEKEHFDNGGLFLRERTDKEPVYHDNTKERGV